MLTSCWDKGEQHDCEHYDGANPRYWICRKCLMLGADISHN